MKCNFKLMTAGLTLLTLGACSSVHKTGEKEATTVSKESKKIAVEENATYVTELSFDRNSANLDSGSRQKLDEILSRAKSSGQIDEIKVITWSDLEYPSKKKGKLSKAQDRLAETRGENIKNYLIKSDHHLDIDTFNMAKRPNSLSKLFKTEDFRIKKSLESAGLSHGTGKHEYPNKAGKSSVMVILKE